jgi:hypothetical protein
MSTSIFLRSMTKPQQPSECPVTRPSTTCSHQSTGWLSRRSNPSSSSRMPGHAPAGPSSHSHPFPCAGPPTCKECPPPILPVCSHEHQVTVSRQLGGSLKEPTLHLLPVCSQEHQVTASLMLGGSLKEPPLHSLLVCSQEHQVTARRALGGSLKEPPLHPLPVRSPECQVTISKPTGCSPRHPSALPPMATQPPPPMSRTAQVGFPGTHSWNR